VTTLFFHNGFLACDSNHQLPGVRGECYIAPTKVVSFDEPVSFHVKDTVRTAEEGKSWIDGVPGCPFPLTSEQIDDRLHGYTVTGSTTHAERFIEVWQTRRQSLVDSIVAAHEASLAELKKAGVTVTKDDMELSPSRELIVAAEREAFSSVATMAHHAFHTLRLNAADDEFTLLLIGEKAVYRYRPDDRDTPFIVVPHRCSHAYGSGCEYVIEYFRQYESYVLSVMATMLMDPGSQGFIELWKLPTVEEPVLHRQAMWYPLKDTEMRALLQKNMEPPPDLLSLKESRRIAMDHFEAGAFFGQCPDGLARQRKLMEKDPALAQKGIEIFAAHTVENQAFRDNVLADWKAKNKLLVKPPRRPKSKKPAKASTPTTTPKKRKRS